MTTEITSKSINLWLGTEASLDHIIRAGAKMFGELNPRASCGDEDDDDEISRLTQISNGVAVINVHGSLTSRDSWWNAIFGITSYNDIRNAIVEAIEMDEVNRIILDIDSSGGDAKGVGDLAEFIKSANERKTIDAHVSGTAFSAAYWIASACNSTSGPRMSEAGSIGVIAILAEFTEMYKKAGVKVHVFRAGKYKALGNPYEKLSKEAKDIIQGRIEKTEGFFLDAVSENRGIPRSRVKSEAGEGLTFFAEEAVENGLMDEILSFDDLYNRVVKSSNSVKSDKRVLAEETDMSKKVLTEKAVAALSAGASEEEVQELMEEQAAEEGGEAEESSAQAAEEQATEEGVEAEEISAQTEEEQAAEEGGEAAAGTDSLVTYLKDELKQARDENSELRDQVKENSTAAANEEALKTIVSEYVGNMCIALGVSALDMSSMSTSNVLAQYQEVRTKYTEHFVVGGVAEVLDDEPETGGEGVSFMTARAAKANKI